MELSMQEEMLIEIIRSYNFLRKFDYDYEHFNIDSREPGVVYLSKTYHRRIIVTWGGTNHIDITIQKTKGVYFFKEYPSFDLKDVCKQFGYLELLEQVDGDNFHAIIQKSAQLMQKHFIDIVMGKKWINDIKK
jgi:hypothetical protein